MGREACAAIEAAADLDLVAAVDLGDDVASAFRSAAVEVAVDFTRPDALAAGVPAMLEAGAAVVVGTSGVSPELLDAFAQSSRACDRPVLVVPNFSVGIVLLQGFATRAARFYREVEILELHHEKKVDSPSGTAADTARRIAAVRDTSNTNADASVYRGGRIDDIPVHSVRLPGLLAHQVVMFGADGEVLSLRHDSMSRASFMPGVLAALRGVRDLTGVVVGLEHCLPEG